MSKHHMSKRYTAEDKYKIIKYSYQHGIQATLEAVALTPEGKHRGLSRATLCRWRKKWRMYCDTNDDIGNTDCLKDKSSKPIHYRQSVIVHPMIRDKIKEYRTTRPGTGKKKLKVLIDRYCDSNGFRRVSESTIGRVLKKIIHNNPHLAHLHKSDRKVSLDGSTGRLYVKTLKNNHQKKKDRRKDYTPKQAGDLVQIDCVVYIIHRVRIYLVNAVDTVSKFAYSRQYTSLSSNTTTEFFKELEQLFPARIKHIQTDNGSEFHGSFRKYVSKQGIKHFYSYPRKPQQNAYIERYNRTLQEEFSNHNQTMMYQDYRNAQLSKKKKSIKPTNHFNTKLTTDYLIYYNFQRPHQSLQNMTPMEYLKQHLPDTSYTESRSTTMSHMCLNLFTRHSQLLRHQ